MSSSEEATAAQAWRKILRYGSREEVQVRVGRPPASRTNSKGRKNKTNTSRQVRHTYGGSTRGNNTTKHKTQRNRADPSSDRIHRLNQTDLFNRNQDHEDNEEFGDQWVPRPEGIVRIISQNVANLPENAQTAKSRQCIDFIRSSHASLFSMQEVGLFMSKLRPEDQWFARVIGKFSASSATFAYNMNETAISPIRQPGGVGIIATENVHYRVQERGRDETGLGRWCWVVLQGKQHHRTRLISAYRPCVGSPGPTTVYQQHVRHLLRTGRDSEPRRQFYIDLRASIVKWKQEGDHIVVTMDANEDVRTGETAAFFRSVDMKEAILTRHHTRSPPATHNRNRHRQPIDGIWVTMGLRPV